MPVRKGAAADNSQMGLFQKPVGFETASNMYNYT
jgi:hypothetical protein